MKLDLTDTLYALSFALDTVQEEMGEISNHHGKNVAFIACIIGKYLGYDRDSLNDLVGLAILHDNAYTEYVREEYFSGVFPDYETLKAKLMDTNELREGFLKAPKHCVVGERNIKLIPFHNDVTNVILYHHENADGSGPLGKKEDEVPEFAQIIHIADLMDVFFDLRAMSEYDFILALKKMASYKGKLFSEKMVDALINSLSYEDISYLQTLGAIAYLKENVETAIKDYTDDEIENICLFFSKIVDYKSSVTKKHSLDVALKCYEMATFYDFSDEKRIRFFFAGAMHDIGKLVISNEILEKPSALTKEEMFVMMHHVDATNLILSGIKGIEDITEWASNHHERLNGKGYPRGLREFELSFEDKLLQVIDIYVALREVRGYKPSFTHSHAIDEMLHMVADGLIDRSIVLDINNVFLDT